MHKDQRPSDGTVFLDEAFDKNCSENLNHTQMIVSKIVCDYFKGFILDTKYK